MGAGPVLRRQSTHRRFRISEPEDIGAARRTAMAYAEQVGAGPGLAGRVGQATTELGTNLLRHATGDRWILVRPLPPDAVEVLAVDRGPGIADLPRALGDGPAPPWTPRGSAAGLGCGLAAVRRSASRFDIHSVPGRGTVVLAVFDPHWRSPEDVLPASVPPPRHWAGVSTSIAEECGDAWAVVETGCDRLVVLLVDGLGHGVHASIAADAAVRTLALDPEDLAGYLLRANQALRETRGAALAGCALRPVEDRLDCLSVGNINGRVVDGDQQQGLVPYSGTVGLRVEPPKVPLMGVPWPPGATLVLWSDGLDSRIDLTAEADLLRADPAVTAAVLHRDHSRDRDDATVVVVRRPAR